MDIITVVIVIIIGLGLGFAKLCAKTMLLHREVYEKTFSCPNCGARFRVKWYQMIFNTEAVYTYNAAHLKCPVCHKKDMCSVTYDER